MTDPTQNLATLFADIVDSAGLYRRHGDRVALAAIEGCLRAMIEITEDYGGRVLKTIGDELMAVFANSADAFHAACEMQWRVSDLPELGRDRLELRIGFHVGPTVDRGSDVFGESVNVAARLVKIARPGQVIVSGHTVEAAGHALAGRTRKLPALALKGMAGLEVIHEAIWRDSDTLTAVMADQTMSVAASVHLVLRYEGTVVVAGPTRPRVTCGRDASNDIVVGNAKASRVHALIEWRRDRFVVIDQSTNGTWVLDDRGREAGLRREDMALQGSGLIGLGAPASAPGDAGIEFSCETLATARSDSAPSEDAATSQFTAPQLLILAQLR